MLLESIIPQLPSDMIESLVYIVAALGGVLLTYAVFVEAEHRRDLIRIVGAGGIFVYALYIQNLLFMIAMGGVFIASLVEFIEIYLGLHKHSKHDLGVYKKHLRLAKNKD